ncbi:hypothetical protein ROZALSC1DRAFT_28502 [Rozella allomycis CSF55]|uniref:Ribosomal protein L24e-related domain-containing protein n=1 Tax=Rozella allomycis (strain CSF55) TaxID=988480 RepID=A0A075AW92_ROZAC|nr:Ribosomal protein L24e-related domain-containing protein [Rozella allomycis CSF55]RKP19962.1 hypothetical protein ROZALSC1DRAFT_28502 [Rozella allomycis CSF55]|eukprot:EPZ32977.1 Ribosomal protein L24e-related domain-containing protein [Rozella allomycis CSF55]
MRLEKCFFCSSTVYPGHGIMFVRNDAKNFKMKRNPRKTKWTKAFRRSAGKEMTVDSTFEFEKRRNVPVRYDRNLMETTVKAIKRIQEIKSNRARQFFVNRMKHKKEQERKEMHLEVERGIDLIISPLAAKQKIKETSEMEMDTQE